MVRICRGGQSRRFLLLNGKEIGSVSWQMGVGQKFDFNEYQDHGHAGVCQV